MSIDRVVASLVNKHLPSWRDIKIGARVRHPSGRIVKITAGYYKDPTYGRISNHWTYFEVFEDGSLSNVREQSYGWDPDDLETTEAFCHRIHFVKLFPH